MENNSGNRHEEDLDETLNELYEKEFDTEESKTRHIETRKPGKQASPFMEWLSDYLRYFILAGIIVVVAVIAIIAIKNIQSGTASAENTAVSSSSAVKETSENTSEETTVSSSVTETVSSSVTETASSSASTETSAVSEETTSQDSTDSGDDSSDASEEAALDSLIANPGLPLASNNLTTVIEQYLNALADGDTDAANEVCEELDENTIFGMQNGYTAEYYDNIKVYSYDGDSDGTYIAITTFEYKMRNSDTVLPGITAYYVYTGKTTGKLYIGSSSTQADNQSQIDAVCAKPEVNALISAVQAKSTIIAAKNS